MASDSLHITSMLPTLSSTWRPLLVLIPTIINVASIFSDPLNTAINSISTNHEMPYWRIVLDAGLLGLVEWAYFPLKRGAPDPTTIGSSIVLRLMRYFHMIVVDISVAAGTTTTMDPNPLKRTLPGDVEDEAHARLGTVAAGASAVMGEAGELLHLQQQQQAPPAPRTPSPPPQVDGPSSPSASIYLVFLADEEPSKL
ncbi:uncharacterized protein B0I36DRAFT_389721 [Microdochium trichocladiopsis]|uniref:Uncharacterized protein n=1 Tax=Microdochium trichocladiopsis TaxID=1682393 RepID=A0A9P8XQS3_9PEZI|nr:uncharacterized protein B0I36DRAFT_389721 [Microdochium trichocladiopsis]KAH7012265.1 hypothetical protein B0I36DRAFT_389721 [Microdochium trichocladiopsis]